MKVKKVKDSVTVMSRLMTPNDVNLYGTVHGGVILRMLDEIGAVCASKHSSSSCVTASVDKVDFYYPIYIGEVITMRASVNYVGRASMEIGVKVSAQNLKTGKIRHTNSCYLTYVAINKKGRPVKVPRLIPETPEEKRRFNDGKNRREERLKILKKK